jgi:hypothetical protein
MSTFMDDEVPDDKVEITFRFSKELYEKLLTLREKVDADDLKEVIMNAYHHYEAHVNEAKAGASFFIQRTGDVAPVPY